MAPFVPYPMDGRVYDVDGSTAIEGATVIVLNVTTGERTSIKTDSSGDFIIDLANFASGYSDGDRIQGTISYGSGSGIRCMSRRHTVDTAVGAYSAGDVILHPGNDNIGTCFITFAGHSNSHSGNLYVDFYDRTNDVLVFRLETIAGDVTEFPFGYLGQKMDGGFIRIYESEAAGRSVVSVVFK